MLEKSLPALTANDISGLVNVQIEGKTLEFKRELPAAGDEGNLEILKDISALANSDGGDILYGVAEVKGIASKLFPIQLADVAKAKLRIHQVLDAGLTPHIAGIEMQHVGVDGGFVLILRVPASRRSPHQVIAAHLYKFFGRNNAGTYVMGIDELRDIILRRESLAGSMRQFRRERVELIRNRPEDMPSAIDEP